MRDDEYMRVSADYANALDFIQKMKKEFDQQLGREFSHGEELSGGQWQRIALARAFFKNAPILILDEPTSAIDAKAEAEIFEKLRVFMKEKTVIFISHRFSTVRNADRIIVLDEGHIVEDGKHEELMSHNGKYKQMFEHQAKGYK